MACKLYLNKVVKTTVISQNSYLNPANILSLQANYMASYTINRKFVAGCKFIIRICPCVPQRHTTTHVSDVETLGQAIIVFPELPIGGVCLCGFIFPGSSG